MWKLVIQIALKLFMWWMEREETKAQTKRQFLALVDDLTGHDQVGDLKSKYHNQIARLQKQIEEQAGKDQGRK